MHSPMLMECLFLFSLFFCPCSSYINSKYTLQLQCTPRPVQLFVYSSIGVCEGGGGESVLCFIVVLFIQTCVGITTRTVCVVAIGCYEWMCKLQMFPS